MPKLITASYKQRKFVNEYLKHGSIQKAAMEAYDASEKSAYNLGRATLQQPTTLAYMRRILDKSGLTDDKIANGLKAIYEASLSENSLKQAKPSDGLKAIQEMSKLKDLYPVEKKQIEKKTLSIKLEGKTNNELLELLAKQEQEIKTFRKLLSNVKNVS